MSKVIEVTNLSKKYVLCHEQKSAYSTIVSSLTQATKRFFRSLKNPFQVPSNERFFEEFWALKEVNFECEEGDRIALIGKNGAGKSTFLKILSRIIEPSEGRIKIRGRVSSLLEVGTGFHPELTGRENIFLNGAILGMGKQEITKKFDEIIAFSEVEKFLDTPVKYYSSGMYARLGFAIAAHLDPDILIVDEVLAVGDIQFQEKCLNKLDDVSKAGRTILFVSHNTSSLLSLCNKGALFVNGMIKKTGPIEECINEYLQGTQINTLKWTGELGDEAFKIFLAELVHPREFFYQHEIAQLKIQCEIIKPLEKAFLGIEIKNNHHQVIAHSYLNLQNEIYKCLHIPKSYQFSLSIDLHYFWEGNYTIFFTYFNSNRCKIISDEIALKFSVYKSPDSLHSNDLLHNHGILLPDRWQIEKQIEYLSLTNCTIPCLK